MSVRIAVGVVVCLGMTAGTRPGPRAAAAGPRAVTAAAIPFVFEENRGQVAGDARFVARGQGYVMSLGPASAAVRLSGSTRTFGLTLVGGAPAPRRMLRRH